MNMQLRTRIYANDRLLMSLIALLGMRDPHLIDEMEAVIELVIAEDDAPEAQREAWDHLRREMEMIRTVAQAPARGTARDHDGDDGDGDEEGGVH